MCARARLCQECFMFGIIESSTFGNTIPVNQQKCTRWKCIKNDYQCINIISIQFSTTIEPPLLQQRIMGVETGKNGRIQSMKWIKMLDKCAKLRGRSQIQALRFPVFPANTGNTFIRPPTLALDYGKCYHDEHLSETSRMFYT